MSTGIIEGVRDGDPRRVVSIFYDSATMTAFGPLLDGFDYADAEKFLAELDRTLGDPRSLEPVQLERAACRFAAVQKIGRKG